MGAQDDGNSFGAIDMPTVSEVRDQAIEVARGWSGPDVPASWRLTSALFEAVAGDNMLLEAIAPLAADRLPALVAGAAITLLARRETSAAIHAYFPEPGSPQPPFDDGFFPAFRRFCSVHLDDIVSVCQKRRYQMNEVARCTQLACGMAATVGAREEPVALVDLGTGAGLALGLDRYHYRVGDRSAGPPESPVRLSCALWGRRMPPLSRLPRIAERLGVDLDPIDLDDEGSREWLEACAPPEHEALRRLTTAVGELRRHPPTILRGDVVEVLPEVGGGDRRMTDYRNRTPIPTIYAVPAGIATVSVVLLVRRPPEASSSLSRPPSRDIVSRRRSVNGARRPTPRRRRRPGERWRRPVRHLGRCCRPRSPR